MYWRGALILKFSKIRIDDYAKMAGQERSELHVVFTMILCKATFSI